MCGRYANAKKKAELIEEFGVTEPAPEDLAADYNIAPSKKVWIVRDHKSERALDVAKWGLVPFWAKDPSIGKRMNNARLETADNKPAFRQAWRKRRVILPADGFYEWHASTTLTSAGKPRKQPYYLHLPDETLAMAGLYELWRDKDKPEDDEDAWLTTFTILTTRAVGAAEMIHERMPLHVSRENRDAWLDPAFQGDPRDLLDPAETARQLEAYPVSLAVNAVKNNTPDLIKPLPA